MAKSEQLKVVSLKQNDVGGLFLNTGYVKWLDYYHVVSFGIIQQQRYNDSVYMQIIILLLCK